MRAANSGEHWMAIFYGANIVSTGLGSASRSSLSQPYGRRETIGR